MEHDTFIEANIESSAAAQIQKEVQGKLDMQLELQTALIKHKDAKITSLAAQHGEQRELLEAAAQRESQLATEKADLLKSFLEVDHERESLSDAINGHQLDLERHNARHIALRKEHVAEIEMLRRDYDQQLAYQLDQHHRDLQQTYEAHQLHMEALTSRMESPPASPSHAEGPSTIQVVSTRGELKDDTEYEPGWGSLDAIANRIENQQDHHRSLGEEVDSPRGTNTELSRMVGSMMLRTAEVVKLLLIQERERVASQINQEEEAEYDPSDAVAGTPTQTHQTMKPNPVSNPNPDSNPNPARNDHRSR